MEQKMENRAVVEKTVEFVKDALANAEGGHDWYHTERVRNMALHLREREGRGDILTIELASLLHDVADAKFHGGDEEEGGRMAFNFLMRQDLDQERAEHVQTIVRYISFKGGFPQERIHTVEFEIVQDADRLDALGAIGIARAFNYGGYRNRPIYDPSIPPAEYNNSGEYYRSSAPTINHFYEKLLRLKDLMNTRSGIQIAEERHAFMLEYLSRFYRENAVRTGNSD